MSDNPKDRTALPDEWPIDPYVTSGIDLADILNRLRNAFNTTQFGSGQPPEAQVGTLWTSQEATGNIILWLHTGGSPANVKIGDTDGIGIDEINMTEIINYLEANFDIGVEQFGPAGNKRKGDVTPMEGDYKIGQMEDVYIAGPQDKDALCYEDGTQTWKPKKVVTSFNGQSGDVMPGEGDYALDDLRDVEVSGAAVDAVLLNTGSGASPWVAGQVVNSFKGRKGAVMPAEADYTLTLLGDVALSGLAKDDMLQFNGTAWENNPPKLIDTELTFAGPIDPNVTAPAAEHAWIYIANKEGNAHPSFTGIAGNLVRVGNALGYSTNHDEFGNKVPDGTGGAWFLLGDVFSAAVTSIGQGQGILVDSSTASTPVVSVNRQTVDAWYAAKDHLHTGVYEPAFAKNSAFNKNFGGTGTATTVARSDHNHDGTYAAKNHSHGDEYATADHLHDDRYERLIGAKGTAFNKNFGGTGAATTVSRSDHSHSGYSLSGHDHDGDYAPNPHYHNEYEPKFTKKSGFNKDFGTGYDNVARGSHTHDGYSTSGHTHTLGEIGGGVAINNQKHFIFPQQVTAQQSLNVSGGYLNVVNYISCDGHIYSGTTLRAGGDVIAYYSSDERLKDNIRSIDNVLNKVCQIRSIEFEWNDSQEEYEGTDVGVSAQSVQAVFPSLVKEREQDSMLGVRYEKLAGPMIGAITELRDMVLALQAEVDELKSKLGDQ